MKKTLVVMIGFLGLFLFFKTPTHAQVIMDVTGGLRTNYVAGNGFVIHDDHVGQIDFWFTMPHGFYADWWISSDLEGRNNWGREVDYGVGWASKWLDVGIFCYDLSDLFSSAPDGDIISPHVELYKTIAVNEKNTVRVHVRREENITTRPAHADSGAFTRVGISSALIFGRAKLVQDTRVLHDGGVWGSRKGFIGSYEIGLGYQLIDTITFRPVFKIITPLSSSVNDRGTETVYSLEFTRSFSFGK